MRLDDDTYEFIKEEVIDLYVRYDVRCIPVSGFELAITMGIILVPYSSLSQEKYNVAIQTSPDGFYFEPGDGKEYIYYNDDIGYKRCNMTILHEIGHAVLGHSNNTDPDIAESEAAFFAKYAAAPPPLIDRLKDICTENISEIFCISYEAAFYAYEYYNKWKRHHDNCGKFAAYEERLYNFYGIIA